MTIQHQLAEEIFEMDKACAALYVQVPKSVADDVKKRFENLKKALASIRSEQPVQVDDLIDKVLVEHGFKQDHFTTRERIAIAQVVSEFRQPVQVVKAEEFFYDYIKRNCPEGTVPPFEELRNNDGFKFHAAAITEALQSSKNYEPGDEAQLRRTACTVGNSIEQVECPEFPFFGATYPDARCIDGYLWDLDKCDDNGLYSSGDNPPCPFCNTEKFIEYHTNIDDKELESMKTDESLDDKDREDILSTNLTREDATKLAESYKAKYLKSYRRTMNLVAEDTAPIEHRCDALRSSVGNSIEPFLMRKFKNYDDNKIMWLKKVNGQLRVFCETHTDGSTESAVTYPNIVREFFEWGQWIFIDEQGESDAVSDTTDDATANGTPANNNSPATQTPPKAEQTSDNSCITDTQQRYEGKVDYRYLSEPHVEIDGKLVPCSSLPDSADLFEFKTDDERLEHMAQMISYRFLSEVEKECDRRNLSRAELASMVGTSASYITQLFRGTKRVNMDILAKFEDVLNLTFTITVKEQAEQTTEKGEEECTYPSCGCVEDMCKVTK